MPSICIMCSTKKCEHSELGKLDFCEYGIAFYNDNGEIKKKEEAVTLRHMSQNLRHELNKVLQTIVTEASILDPTISIKKIDINKPASRIVGATVIIDQFIEMIAGVNEFHPNRSYSSNLDKKVNLYAILDKYSQVYSLVRNTRRARNLNILIKCDLKTKVIFSSHIIEYICSIFIDNIWKYSVNNSKPVITTLVKDSGDIDLEFINISDPISDIDVIFEKGHQINEKSEGFGYGLFWATLLVNYYNELSGRDLEKLTIDHNQRIDIDGNTEQVFTIRNIRCET